ncbi:MAG TPA: ImmA/IrrE family metallo-endopeptidase [Burkholderiales bacterium]|nr:ImmA/IrrE family metallo-endopeptidase [Burkholderiales bacterium]
MTDTELSPSTAAYRLTHILNALCAAHSLARFPVDITTLAREAANIFHWQDPISQVEAADIQRFEGALYPNGDGSKWVLLYNSSLSSPGRIRFTQAHELGHYILHRHRRHSFECSEADMINLLDDEASIEVQADIFASTLLMPLDDFRRVMPPHVDFEALGVAAERYGVSLTAATLRWLKHTSTSAVVVVHRDGFINWAFSSNSAFENGAFFKTRNRVLAIPNGSLASDLDVAHDRQGIEVPATVWFPYASSDVAVREMKISSDQYDWIMSLIVLPRGLSVWKPREYG